MRLRLAPFYAFLNVEAGFLLDKPDIITKMSERRIPVIKREHSRKNLLKGLMKAFAFFSIRNGVRP
jgi:hypothetical protein